MKRMHKLLSVILFIGVMLSMMVFTSNGAKSFTDVSRHWAKEYIEEAVSRGYVSGYSDGTFKPDNSITRAEFCKMLNSALGLSATTSLDFSDVTSSKWFYSDVQKAVAAGYISGYDNGTFSGDNKISRQEAALVIARITTAPSSSKDITALRDSSSISSWALEGAKAVYSKGYMAGDNLRRFNPAGNLTRAEAVKIIETLLDKETIVKSNLTVSSSGQTFSDKIYVGSVIISSDLGSGNVTFNNCRVLGTMLVNGGGSSGIRLAGSRVSNMTINNSKNTVGVACAGASSVTSTYASTPCALTEASLTGLGKGFEHVTLGGTALSGKTVTISGVYDSVTMSAKAGLSLASGSISSLTVNSAAAGSTINLSSGAVVSLATINASCDFTGTGKITKAVQNVSGVTYATTPGTITGSGSGTGSKYVSVSSTPKNGDKRVDTDEAIIISFGQAVTNSDGGALTSSYIQNSGIELRRDSATGTKIAFYAAVGTNSKSITIVPLSSFKDDTTYYIVVKAGAFRTSGGLYNQAYTASFSTGDGKASDSPLVPTVTPSDGSLTIPVNTEITMEFSDKIYDADGDTLTSSYVRSSAVEFRRGSRTGTKVSFSATVSSDRKRITITPSSDLDVDTKYYVILLEDSICDSDDNYNKEQTFSFTTAESEYLVPTVEPASGSSDIDLEQEFVFTFEDRMYNASGNTLTSSYLQNSVFTLRRGSATGTKVDFSASISSDKRTITIQPDEELDSDTDYYIVIASGSMTDEYFDEVSKMVFNYTTGDGGSSSSSGKLTPSSTSPKNGKSGVARSTDITLTYSQALKTTNGDTLNGSYIEDEAITLRRGSATGTKVSFTADVSSSKKVITLVPDSDLTKNTKYYVTVNQGVFENSSGTENTKYTFSFTVGTTSSGMLEPYETSPSDNATGISASSTIKLYFDEAIYQDNGSSSLSSSYMKNTAFEIRRGSSSGTKVTFSASINSTKKTVTLTPSSLSEGYTYYVILNGETIANSDGDLNDEYIFSFSVGSTGSTTPSSVSPSNGTTNVSTSPQITLSFNNTVYRNSSKASMTASHIKSNIQIRRGTNSSSASTVSYTPSVSSTGKTVTLVLNQTLDQNTTYYIYIPSYTFYNSSGSGNSSSISYYFTTRGATTITAPTMSPANGETNVAPGSGQIRLSYTDSLLTSSSSTVTSDYLTSNIRVTKGSSTGTAVNFTAGISSSKVITITPTDGLEYDTKYYVSISSGVFKTSAGATSQAVSYSFSTKKPTLSLSETHTKDSATITVNYDYSGASEDVYFKMTRDSAVIFDGFIPKTQKGSFNRELDGLSEGTSYTVTVVMTYGSGKTLSQSIAFTTNATSKNSSLESLEVEDSMGTYRASYPSSGGSATIQGVLEPSGGSVWVTATAADPKATIKINGQAVSSGSAYHVNVHGETSIDLKIVVTAENGSTSTYNLTLPIKVDEPLPEPESTTPSDPV